MEYYRKLHGQYETPVEIYLPIYTKPIENQQGTAIADWKRLSEFFKVNLHFIFNEQFLNVQSHYLHNQYHPNVQNLLIF